MRLLLAALVAGAGWFAYMARRPRSGHQGPGRPPQGRGERHAAADCAHSDFAVEQPVVVARPATPPDQFAHDKEHQRAERDYWRRSMKVSVVGTVIAFGAFLFAGGAFVASYGAMRETREQARIAQQALITSDRPWIEVTGVSVNDVQVAPWGVSINVTVRTKNIGRSPALRAIETILVMVDTEDDEPVQRSALVCRDAGEDRTSYQGIEGVMFPDATRTSRYIRLADMDEVQRGLDRLTRRDALPHRRRTKAKLAIIGCTTYRFGAVRAVGQTAFVYELARRCGTAELPLPCDFDLTKTAGYSETPFAKG